PSGWRSRAGAERGGPPAARTGRVAGPPGTGRPRPRTRPPTRGTLPGCRRLRSTFFRPGVRVGDGRDAGLARADGRSRRAPGAGPLERVPGPAENLPDGERRDRRQPIG